MARGAAGRLTATAEAGAAPAETARARAPRYEGLILAGVVVIGAVLRGIDLNDGLWYDEIGTLVRYVRRPLAEIVTRFDTQNQHMLYSILAHVALRLFGEQPWTLRLPAAVFGVASIWAVWWLGVRLVSRREALVAAGLLAVSSHAVWFSQDARGYTMLMFFSIAGTRLFLDLLERPTWRLAGWYAVVMALATWTQVAGAFVVVAHGAVWLLPIVSRKPYAVSGNANGSRPTAHGLPIAGLLGAGLLTIALYAPVLKAMTHTLVGPKATGGAPEWKSFGWFVSTTISGLARGVPGGLVAVAVALVIVIIGLASLWRRSASGTLLLVMPVVVTAVVMAISAHNLWPRLFFFALGFAALIAVRGGFEACGLVFKARGELVATVGAAAVGVASLATVPRVWAPKQDFGGAMEWLRNARGATEPVITVDMTRLPYRDYFATTFVPVDSVTQLAQAETTGAHAWVLVTFPERLQAVDPAIWSRLQERYLTMRRFPSTVDGGTITVMRTR